MPYRAYKVHLHDGSVHSYAAIKLSTVGDAFVLYRHRKKHPVAVIPVADVAYIKREWEPTDVERAAAAAFTATGRGIKRGAIAVRGRLRRDEVG